MLHTTLFTHFGCWGACGHQTSPPFPETKSSCRPLLTSSQTYKHGHSPVELECPQQVAVEGCEELTSASFLLASILEELEQHAEVK